MITGYNYELWNGKEVVGHHYTLSPVLGATLTVPEVSIFKQSYYAKTPTIVVPIIQRVVSRDYVDLHLRTCLDVRKKSKRQIAFLRNGR